MGQQKQAIVTFKAEQALAEALRAIPNRSAFIRAAVLAALDNVCPLCHGTGILSPDQKRHWEKFAESHRVAECDECHEWHLICTNQQGRDPHRTSHT
jgi:hypothetical protein